MKRLRRWRAALNERDGFTLVEVMVVLIIITIGILPLALVQNRARQEVNEADRYTTAMTVAQEQLEWAKGMGFDDAQPDSGTTGAVQWTTRIDDIDVGLRQIRVTVIFAQGGRPDTLAMASLLSMR
jgi:prepilin-type N-terminal cleavage/methylation domain-containing protein